MRALKAAVMVVGLETEVDVEGDAEVMEATEKEAMEVVTNDVL